MTAKATPSIVQTPAARPSTPSEKFTTFISATSQTTVSGPPSWGNCSEPTNGIARFSITAPPRTATIAAANLPKQLEQRIEVDRVVDRTDQRDQPPTGEHRPGVHNTRPRRTCRAAHARARSCLAARAPRPARRQRGSPDLRAAASGCARGRARTGMRSPPLDARADPRTASAELRPPSRRKRHRRHPGSASGGISMPADADRTPVAVGRSGSHAVVTATAVVVTAMAAARRASTAYGVKSI